MRYVAEQPLFSVKNLLSQQLINPEIWTQLQSQVGYLVMFGLEDAFNQLFFDFDGNYFLTDATAKLGRPKPSENEKEEQKWLETSK